MNAASNKGDTKKDDTKKGTGGAVCSIAIMQSGLRQVFDAWPASSAVVGCLKGRPVSI